MAKKTRRVRRLSATQIYEPTPAQTATGSTTSRPAASVASRQVDFREEYRYILHDLQRIGLLAAVILAGLGILSFFIK
jgi:hypothetical protein